MHLPCILLAISAIDNYEFVLEGDITAGFVPDSCLSRALLQPEYITVGLDYTQLCPGLPVEGEAVGRLYVVRWASQHYLNIVHFLYEH